MTGLRFYAVSSVCALSFALNGCGPSVAFLREAPEFDHAALSAGGISVCGVTASTEIDELHGHELLAAVLEDVLIKERRDLKVLPSDSLRLALGPVNHDAALVHFEMSGELSRAALAVLDSLAGEEVRYLVLARIVEDAVSQEENTTTGYDSNSETTTRTTTLKMRVDFQVYDLQSRQSVWSATLTGNDSNTSTYAEGIPDGGFWESLVSGLLESVVSQILSLNNQEFPPAPDDVKVLRDISSGFAKKLPQAGHRTAAAPGREENERGW